MEIIISILALVGLIAMATIILFIFCALIVGAESERNDK